MLELNKEYTYPKICEALGWEPVKGGGKRQRQIAAVEAAYEWHNPINPKTGKANTRVHVFTKKIGEIEYEDGRKGNGRKPLLSEQDFSLLLGHAARKYGICAVRESETETSVYLFTSNIFRGFGFDVRAVLGSMRKRLRSSEESALVDGMIGKTAFNKAYEKSVKRIASYMRLDSTSQMKAQLYKRTVESDYEVAPEDIDRLFQEEFDVWMSILTANGRDRLKRGDDVGAIANLAEREVLREFSGEKVSRVNRVVIDSSILDVECNRTRLESAQREFHEIVLASIKKGVGSIRRSTFWEERLMEQEDLDTKMDKYLKAFEEASEAVGWVDAPVYNEIKGEEPPF